MSVNGLVLFLNSHPTTHPAPKKRRGRGMSGERPRPFTSTSEHNQGHGGVKVHVVSGRPVEVMQCGSTRSTLRDHISDHEHERLSV